FFFYSIDETIRFYNYKILFIIACIDISIQMILIPVVVLNRYQYEENVQYMNGFEKPLIDDKGLVLGFLTRKHYFENDKWNAHALGLGNPQYYTNLTRLFS
ncbi:hypothetical protein ACJX0J_023998, partial [Zea mays]